MDKPRTRDGGGRLHRELMFEPGERFKAIEVTVLDDAIDEGTEYFLLRFSNPKGAYLKPGSDEVVGLIRNDDHLQSVWLSRIGRAVGNQLSDAISDRLEGKDSSTHVTFAGRRLDLNRRNIDQTPTFTTHVLPHTLNAVVTPVRKQERSFAPQYFADLSVSNYPTTSTPARQLTKRVFLRLSSFQLIGTNKDSRTALASWDRVAHGRFDGEQADDRGWTSVNGEVVTGIIGVNAEFSRLLAGVAVSLSEGDGSFANSTVDRGKSGHIESTFTTVSPYIRFKATERVSAWGLAGRGVGDMTFRFDDRRMAPVWTDLSMQLGAIGARSALLTQHGSSGMDIALKADVFYVQTWSEKAANSVTTATDTSRVRLLLNGGRAFDLGDGTRLRSSLELGLRQDGGDAETGTGVELGSGVVFTDSSSGLSVEAKARMLATHTDSNYEEWGAIATARLDPGTRGRGLSIALSSTVGSTLSKSERLWGVRDLRGLVPGGEMEASRGFAAEAGYRLAMFGDRFTGTPNIGFTTSNRRTRDWRIGWRLISTVRNDPRFEVNLDTVRREVSTTNDPASALMIRSLIHW